MMRTCPRESEVAGLMARGQWPLAAAQELRGHVSVCKACSDLALVAGAFQHARASALAAPSAAGPRLSSAGALWWRAQLRRRNAAVECISRPLVGAQMFALVINLLVVLGFLGFEARHGIGWLDWLEELPQSASQHLADFSPAAPAGSGWAWMVVACAAATLALLAGLAVYFASDKS